MKAIEIKRFVKEKYEQIARQSGQQPMAPCCGVGGCCTTVDYNVFSESYDHLEGYQPDADLGLGCGLPTQFAGIRKGDHVLDLGSGAGNDSFVARALVGEQGTVTGIDFTDAMLEKAAENALKLGFNNVVFVKGDIEEMPFPDHTFDVVISNCVLNLVPDKKKAFGEIWRVLKPSAHFCVSDVVMKGELPEKLKKDVEMYAGCVSGAIGFQEYVSIIEQQGFSTITLHQNKEIVIPPAILTQFMTLEEMTEFQAQTGIYSLTLSGNKT
ncbi:MAG: arsenite methyltransferase [Marinilabiliales bacterium]|nr:arsenite methyltransferase [Marinilabiliales bacterium]